MISTYLSGKTIRASTFPYSQYSFNKTVNGTTTWHGIAPEFVYTMAKVGNFTVVVQNDGDSAGILNSLLNSTADVSMMPFTQTSYIKKNHFSIMPGLYRTRRTMAVLGKDVKNEERVAFADVLTALSPFSPGVWYSVIVAVLVNLLMSAVIAKLRDKNGNTFLSYLKKGIYDFLGDDETPASAIGGKFYLTLLCLFTLLIRIFYDGALGSESAMTVLARAPFSDIGGMHKAGYVFIGSVSGF